jgi:rhodanese-related sulfurtransferase
MFNLFNKTPSISPEDAAGKTSSTSVAFIDVRSQEEFEGGHAEGARNIPLETLANHVEKLKKYQQVYVICQSGGRSARAVSYLLSGGVNAINVAGGTFAWELSHLPME